MINLELPIKLNYEHIREALLTLGIDLDGVFVREILFDRDGARVVVGAMDEDNRVMLAGHDVALHTITIPAEKDTGERSFAWALSRLKSGSKVTRAGWNGPDQFLELQVPDEHSKMTLPYIYITTVQGDRVPWLALRTDLLAQDWTTA